MAIAKNTGAVLLVKRLHHWRGTVPSKLLRPMSACDSKGNNAGNAGSVLLNWLSLMSIDCSPNSLCSALSGIAPPTLLVWHGFCMP